MFTLGLCNLAGSFFSAMPTSGAFTRSAVSEASGVRTPMAGLYTGAIVLLALSILTPYFRYIPKSTLAAVLIVAVIFMVNILHKNPFLSHPLHFFIGEMIYHLPHLYSVGGSNTHETIVAK